VYANKIEYWPITRAPWCAYRDTVRVILYKDRPLCRSLTIRYCVTTLSRNASLCVFCLQAIVREDWIGPGTKHFVEQYMQ